MNLTNDEYYKKFQNLMDIAMSYNGHLHNVAIAKIMANKLYPSRDVADLNED